MKTFCEIIASDFLPAVRALVTQELISKYGMTQTNVAKKMGITQPAVSYYARELRGSKLNNMRENEKLMNLVQKTAADIVAGNEVTIEMHNICQALRDESVLTDKEKLKCCSLCKK